jgi:hypothetical protein
MSKLVCKNCKSSDVIYEDYVGDTSFYRCGTCGQRGDKDKFTQQTVFDKITESPDALASLLVLTNATEITGTYYTSVIAYGAWKSKAEANAVTLARLKEVAE